MGSPFDMAQAPLDDKIAVASRLIIVASLYDFAVEGGAVSTIALRGVTDIPIGARCVGGYVDVLTQLTSGGAATIALQLEAANDILTAVAVASWTVGAKNILPTAFTTGALTASTIIKTTAARDVSVVIGAFALTAGKFRVVLFFLPLGL